MPPAPHRPQPGWPQVLGWYFAGVAATVAGWSFVAAAASAVGSTFGMALGYLLLAGGIAALATRGRELPKRCLTALLFGLATPWVLAAAALALLAWSFAHSNFTF